ncbi:hypothetical protein O9993_17535 [Vibrio lentus]|nr:hypothetical protein [Vibrio lentus]
MGGLASAVCGYFWDLWGADRPRFMVSNQGKLTAYRRVLKLENLSWLGDLETLMAGLAYGEVSSLAWTILQNGADDFMTLSEEAIPQAVRMYVGEWRANGSGD